MVGRPRRSFRAGRAGLRTAFEIGACPFGSEGPELAARLAGHVRGWDAAGRPSLAGLRVSAYPAGAGPPGAQRGAVIDKHHMHQLPLVGMVFLAAGIAVFLLRLPAKEANHES